jgi:hypothetical protein
MRLYPKDDEPEHHADGGVSEGTALCRSFASYGAASEVKATDSEHVITESRKEDYQASDQLDKCLIVRRKSTNRVRTKSRNHREPPTDCAFALS